MASSTAEEIELARSIPARATVCFIWSTAHGDFIAAGCLEEGYAGPTHAIEIMIVRGDVTGKRYIELRKDRARQLRDSAAESFAASIAPLLERIVADLSGASPIEREWR